MFALIFSTNIFVLDIFSVLRCCVQNRLTKFARGEFWLTVNAFMEFPRHEMCHRLQTMEICQYVVGKFNIFLHRIKITTDKCFAEGCPFICRISSEPRLCSVELQTNEGSWWFHNHGEGPLWFKVATTTFTFKTLLRHYAKQFYVYLPWGLGPFSIVS